MKKLQIITVIISSMMFASCGKDFLNVKPSNSTESSQTITTLADAKVMINGLMRTMVRSTYYGRNYMIYGDAKGGDITIASQGRGLDALYVFNHSVNTNTYSSFWSDIYNSILQANNIINGIQKLEDEGTTIDFKNYKGQALTLRALMHYDLVRLYGKTYTQDKSSFGVPVVTQVLDANALPLRNSVDETYSQIITDLKAALPLLPKAKSNGFINYWGNRAIQSRVYLTMGNYDSAFAAAEEIITSASTYSLYSNAEWVGSWAAQFGKESIFELIMAKDQGELGSGSLGFYYLRSRDNNALGNFIASDYYLDRLNQDPTDVRWGIMTNDELSTTRKGACYKYVGSVSKSGDGKDPYTAVNIKVVRLSEIYLTAAEAALKKSAPDPAKAATYVNAIRKRAPALPALTAATVTEQTVLDEKSKEFICEGQRFFDMIRTNKQITFNDEHVGVTMTHRPKTIDRTFFKTILPIAQTDINANPGLEAQQNPGY
ncbi:MAG: RagB/SusD family nutrient uptake outer membrane protein [Sphingobacteriales bacterium 41-5]|nr:MAG: RagB/SusD family nutrient uptake outer membrane protein [Sphingobacteriales bacterium 41-5]